MKGAPLPAPPIASGRGAHTAGVWFAADPFASPGAGIWVWSLETTGTWTRMLQVSTPTDTRADVNAFGYVAHTLCALQHQTDLREGGTSSPPRAPQAAHSVESRPSTSFVVLEFCCRPTFRLSRRCNENSASVKRHKTQD